MRARAYLCIPFLLAAVAGSQAEPAEVAAGPLPAVPGSALEVIEQEILKSPPPREPPGPDPAITGYSIVLAAGSVGFAVWALEPGSEDWGPEERPNQYLTRGMGWGGLQGLLINASVGIGLSELLFPPRDVRGEYGSLLDVGGAAREERAYQILRKRAEQAKRQRVTAALLTVGATILPVGAYYLGSTFVDRSTREKDFGLGYVVGIAIGSLPWAVFQLATRSSDEQVLAAVEARRALGGTP